MFQGKDAVSRILNELHTFLTKQSIRSMLNFPVASIESQSPAVMTLRRPNSFFDYRLWVIPRVSDYSQALFALDIQVRVVWIHVIVIPSFRPFDSHKHPTHLPILSTELFCSQHSHGADSGIFFEAIGPDQARVFCCLSFSKPAARAQYFGGCAIRPFSFKGCPHALFRSYDPKDQH